MAAQTYRIYDDGEKPVELWGMDIGPRYDVWHQTTKVIVLRAHGHSRTMGMRGWAPREYVPVRFYVFTIEGKDEHGRLIVNLLADFPARTGREQRVAAVRNATVETHAHIDP